MNNLKELLPALVNLRQRLHQIPEMAHKEYKTAELIIDYMKSLQPDLILENIGKTGIAVVFNGLKPGKTLLFRAELDALSDEALIQRLALLKDRLHNTTDLATRDRMIRAIEIAAYSRDHAPAPAPEIRPLILGTAWSREYLHTRIRQRLKERLNMGLIEEVEGIHAAGTPWARLEQLGLEYRFVAEFVQGKIQNKNDLFQKLAAAICAFAKRQDTWFRRMERNGAVIHWVPEARLELALGIIHDA